MAFHAVCFGSFLIGLTVVGCSGGSEGVLAGGSAGQEAVAEGEQEKAGMDSNSGQDGSVVSGVLGDEPAGDDLANANSGPVNEAGTGGGSVQDDDSPSAQADPLAVIDGCLDIHVDAYPGQIWAIVALNLLDARLVIQNVSNAAQTLTTNHQWCSFPKYERLLPLDVNDAGNLQTRTFAPGEILWVNLVEGDVTEGPDAVFIRFDRSGGELALYEAPGTYRDFDRIMAFMSWDGGNPTEGREAVAAGAQIWDYNDRIELDPRWGGIVAVGDTRVSDGYASVPSLCLPKQPD